MRASRSARIGVPGERFDSAKAGHPQDFLMVNGPAFNAADPQTFLKNVKLLAATTNRSETGKQVI